MNASGIKQSQKETDAERERYHADPEKKRSSAKRESYQAEPEKKQTAERERYQADPEKKQTAERERYQADPEKKQTAERERYKADPEKKRSAKGNVIGRVLNVLAWRKKCGTGRLSVVPCKTKEAIEKVLPTKLFKVVE
ncbi:hypothetical protein EMCRGX_G009800 [Ephydatia muelleri]